MGFVRLCKYCCTHFSKKTREYYNIEDLWGDAKSTKIASNY